MWDIRKITGNNLLSSSVALSLVLFFTISLAAQAILLPNSGGSTCHGSLGNAMDCSGVRIGESANPMFMQTRIVLTSSSAWPAGKLVMSQSLSNPTIKLTGSGAAATPTKIGTLTGISGSLTGSGNNCWGAFPQGSSVTLAAAPNGGWLFASWDDGVAPYNENPWTIAMDANKAISADFFQDSKISLVSADISPLGKRTPLILVHGNRMETETQFGWSHYIKAFGKDPTFQKHYKVYLFSWDSEQSNAYNGQALGTMIDSLPELADADLTILAHSRGGIIARYFMNRYVIKRGSHESQPGGEKIKWLVTLATPHRGSPGADPIWVDVSFDYNFLYPAKLALEYLYFTELPQIDYHGVWDPQTYPYLLWDDTDNELSAQAVCYYSALSTTPDTLLGEVEQCSALMSKTNQNNLTGFNQRERYFNKIIAYGGNNYTQLLHYRIMKDITAFLSLFSLDTLTWNSMSKYYSEHQLLDLSTVIMGQMPIIPPGYVRVPNSPKRPFKANDGLVPLSSALFLKHDASGLFQFNRNKFSYDKTLLNNSFCQIAECNVIEGAVDHLGFLDNSQIISTVLLKLDRLHHN